MTYEEIKELLKLFFDTYPNTKDITDPEQTINNWLLVLKDYDRESIVNASKLYMTECRFFPSPADIISRIMRGNMIYGQVKPNIPLIETSKKDYIEEQIDYLMTEFCEGGSLGYD